MIDGSPLVVVVDEIRTSSIVRDQATAAFDNWENLI